MVSAIRALPLFLALALSWTAPVASAAPLALEDSYVTDLVDTARREALHEDPYWRTLLHYKRGLFGERSLVVDPGFFLSEDGKHDPEAELAATIRSFFELPDTARVHPVCRFPARFAWLSEALNLDPSRLPVPVCEPFEALVEVIQPRSVTLIFPTAHMNSPASMYGHTLLTIESAHGGRLLSYAINYAAVTTDTFGPLYIVKGLFGSYDGYFSILPYYAKLQEYSDVNDRDIWEYPLNLDPEEVRRLLMHIRELEGIRSDYYFFKENCSYDLLFLLEAARPSLRLTDEFGPWVIPLDTIRAVKKGGLIREAVYRPSKSTKIRHIASQLGVPGRRSALAIAAGTLDPGDFLNRKADRGEQARVLDLAVEVLQYRNAKGEIELGAYQERFIGALRARSGLGEDDEEAYPIRSPDPPDEGHRSNRIYLGGGIREDQGFAEVRLRPAYHDLLDSDRGYTRGSQIVFIDTALRYYPRTERLELERLDLIDIVSIAHRSQFFKHTSWKVSTGLFRRFKRDGRNHLVYGLNTGFGPAFEWKVPGLLYTFVETDLQVGGALDHDYALGAGLSVGLVKNLTEDWKLHVHAKDVYYALGEDGHRLTAGLGQGWRLGHDLGLSLTTGVSRERDRSRFETAVGWNVYF